MVSLRPDQLEDLGQHLANDRHGLGHEPGVGKTPIVCLLAYARWHEEQVRTIWSQPTSLLKKNLVELYRFSEFAPGDAVILREDHKKLTSSWSGPTFTRVKTVRSPLYRVIANNDLVTRYENPAVRFTEYFEDDTICAGRYRTLGTKENLSAPPAGVLVRAELNEKGKPLKKAFEEDEVVADLIAQAAQDGVKVVLCGFRFFTLHYKRLLENFENIDQLIIDEAHKAYGGSESEATLALHDAMRSIKYLAPMTATLLNGRLDTVFPIVHLIQPRYYGSYNGFLEQHAGYIDARGKVTEWINLDKVTKILDRHFTKRTFEATYGKEAVVMFHETVEMSEAHRAKYDEFHDLAMLELEDGTFIDGALPGVATIRARQIMAHPESFGIKLDEPTGKDQRLELHADSSGSLIVFSVHVPEQLRLVELLKKCGRKVGLINGSVTGARRDAVDEGFRNGALDAIVVSPGCADVGFNWGMAEHIIFVSQDYTDTGFQQAYRRGLRGQRTKHLRVTTLAYENSIDQRVQAIEVGKSKLAHAVDEDRPVLSFAA